MIYALGSISSELVFQFHMRNGVSGFGCDPEANFLIRGLIRSLIGGKMTMYSTCL